MRAGASFAAHVGCDRGTGADRLACLQKLPVDRACAPLLFPSTGSALPNASLPPLAPILGWTPTLDGRAEGVPRMPIEAFATQQPPT